jgi:3-methyladenine DNA glycosylase Tag
VRNRRKIEAAIANARAAKALATEGDALMQACGLVNDHIAGCAVRREVSDAQRRALERRRARMLPAR